MEWLEILKVIIQIIQDCQNEGATKQEILETLENRRLVRFSLRRSLRRKGFRGRELRSAVNDALEELRYSDREDLEKLFED